ncbi:uncharacterized membrane protein YhaH (DUF805 family) [Isoptericola jiangsuensis]|uniref:Uncharacterized membrane protein YhaH (DUF805 family) n=1 Tax=Isoptericola jiangsuensis TaxID=548579 RepID=A0A2A9F277_9MICO|nr:DUF805 domain-containing protein [Isoptericola jiangsuensis]PFG44642.1 uncharacterized membrane protein YhaH (DUF805 family) [Isoptericola jiangsuensis]
MGFGDAVKSVFGNYATFSGRARRSEFWFWYLFMAIVGAVGGTVLGITAGTTLDIETGTVSGGFWAVYAVFMLVMLALVLPSIAVSVRRLHDTDRSGFWYFLGFVPFGGIVLLVFWAGEGTPGDNRFGASPKAVAAPVPAAV